MRNRYCLWIACFFAVWQPLRTTASDSLVIRSLAGIDSIAVIDHASFVVDETNDLSWREVMGRSFDFRQDLAEYVDSAIGKKRVTLWLRISLRNATEDSIKMLLLFHRYAYYREVIVFTGADTLVRQPNYFFTRATKEDRKNVVVPAAPGSMVTYLVRIYNPYSNLYPNYFVMTTLPVWRKARAHLYHDSFQDYIFEIMFLAVIVFITMHTLAQYFIRRRKEFIYYALYSFSVFVFFLYRLEHSLYYDIVFSYFPYVYKFCNNPLSILIYYTYFRFARQFVDFRALAPWFYTTIIWIERLLLAALVIDVTCSLLLNNYELRELLFTSLRILLLLVSFAGIYLLLRSRKMVLYFFGIGSLILIIGLLLAMVFTFFPNADPFGLDSIRYMQFGVVLELLCFTSGLSYKSHLIEVEKINTQQQLIGQLEENRRLQEELNTRLEARVKEQTEQILQQQRQLETEKEQQLTLEFTRKITEMELQLLKSQLNPHFYFNTLHNLYGLAMIAPKKAPDAILKLSDIMEYVIYDCRNDRVPVIKELKFINSYVELEKLRYEEGAHINLFMTGDPGNTMICPLLLIQFIENAFKHGLEQHKRNSYLRIHISIRGNVLRYESVNSISDTIASVNGGIGLANVKKRLEIIYPGKHRLDIHSGDHEYKVELSLQLN